MRVENRSFCAPAKPSNAHFFQLRLEAEADVARLITGHVGTTVAICNECVEVCNEVIAGKFDTGLRCPSCHEPVAVVEDSTSPVIAMRCAACGHRWHAEEPGTKKH